ncbi:hypothetical protein FA95DRAFT_1037136 [Auriscalpium vulgare]|uniref:Uncharacterized protein n=1 Tax=Auriscalpium vulgare TaxID=40419 RepID=A0ACB8RXA5_9AGAM|nr:hypothetical protein FA95DRAFT_1037136 [Auriscalpium vulgare]
MRELRATIKARSRHATPSYARTVPACRCTSSLVCLLPNDDGCFLPLPRLLNAGPPSQRCARIR